MNIWTIVLFIVIIASLIALTIPLVRIIIRFQSISLKDTFVYPFILVLALLLVFNIHVLYDNQGLLRNFLLGLNGAINIIKLSFNYSYLDLLVNKGTNETLLLICYFAIFIYSGFALLSLGISLFKVIFANFRRNLFASKREVCYVFGFNEDAINFLKNLSREEKRYVKVVFNSAELSQHNEEKLLLGKLKVRYCSKKYTYKKELLKSLNYLTWFKNRKYHFVTFFSQESENISFISYVKEFIEQKHLQGGYYQKSITNNIVSENQLFTLTVVTKGKTFVSNIDNNGKEPLYSYYSYNGKKDEATQIFVFLSEIKDSNIKVKTSEYFEIKKENGEKYFKVNNGSIKVYNDTIYNIDSKYYKKIKRKTTSKINVSIDGVVEKYELNTLHYDKGANTDFIICCTDDQMNLFDDLITSSSSKNDTNVKYLNQQWSSDLADYSYGLISIYNKYDIIAFDFIRRYSLASFIDRKDINDNLTISNNCDINLFVIGFGKVNQAILRDILVNNQFAEIEEKDGKKKLKPKRINVIVYDKELRLSTLSFSSSFLKYRKDKYNSDLYFELPEQFIYDKNLLLPCNIGQKDFLAKVYDAIKERMGSGDNLRKQYNFFVVSLDSDSINWDTANVIQGDLSKFSENICKNIFFIRTKEYQQSYYEKYFSEEKRMYPFGIEFSRLLRQDTSCVAALSYDNVVKDDIYYLAKVTHSIYNNTSNKLDEKITGDNKYIDNEWRFITTMDRKSNIYAIASLYFKLSLAGVLCFNGNYDEDALKELRGKYNKKEIDLKNYIYQDDFSIADVYAFLEHERWNAFEFSCGALPMKKEEMLQLGAAKTPNKLVHANIATEQGLVEFYDFVEQEHKKGNLLKVGSDVICYDYGLMDNFIESDTILSNLKLKKEKKEN